MAFIIERIESGRVCSDSRSWLPRGRTFDGLNAPAVCSLLLAGTGVGCLGLGGLKGQTFEKSACPALSATISVQLGTIEARGRVAFRLL